MFISIYFSEMHGAVRANKNLGQNKLRIPIEN